VIKTSSWFRHQNSFWWDYCVLLHLYFFKVAPEAHPQPQKEVPQPVTENTEKQKFIPYSEREWLTYTDS